MLRYLALAVLSFLCFAPHANADDFGLAMHGTPKYDAKDDHLRYANPSAPKDGDIRMQGIGSFDTVNPFSIKGKAAEGLNLVYDRLMVRVWDEPFTLYPSIARKAIVPTDRSSITFQIDTRARFHDGSAITVEDVLFSFETLKEKGRPNMRRVYQLVSKIERLDGNTVKFTFGPGYDRETAMIVAMMPVLSKKWWQGRDFNTTIVESPLLSGPYKIKRIDPGRQIVYERNKDYWAKNLFPNKGLYNFDQITYDYYRDDTVAFEAFKSGDLDLRREFDENKWATAYNPKDFSAVRTGAVVRENFPHGRPEKVRSFIFNTRREPFNDIRVREALDLLFDFDWINKNLFNGQYKRIESFYPNSQLAATGTPDAQQLAVLNPWKEKIAPEIFGEMYHAPASENAVQRRENMRKADALLKDAGWIVRDGKRQKDGKPFKFEIVLSAPEDEKIALHFKRALAQMGIEINIRVLDAAAYIGRLNEYDYDMTLYYWLSTLSPGTEQILYYGCQAAKEPARFNYAGICDPAIDAIAAQIPRTVTRDDLLAHVRALDRVLMHGHYMIPLYYTGKDHAAFRRIYEHKENTPLYGIVLESWWRKQPLPVVVPKPATPPAPQNPVETPPPAEVPH